jgi:hypothetical protein
MQLFSSNGRGGYGGRRKRGCLHFDEYCFARCTADYPGKAELLNGAGGAGKPPAPLASPLEALRKIRLEMIPTLSKLEVKRRSDS